MAIKTIKTPWYKIIKLKRKRKKWNKKYGNKTMTLDETVEALADWQLKTE